jgi:hypothetical protein
MRRLRRLSLIVLVILFAWLSALLLLALRWPLVGKFLVGNARIHVQQVDARITVEGVTLHSVRVFRARGYSTEAYLLYVASASDGGRLQVVGLVPAHKLVGRTLNGPEREYYLLFDRVLIQSDMAYPIIPLEMTIKSGMRDPRFNNPTSGVYTFIVQPDCSEVSAASDWCGHKSWERAGWEQHMLGSWRIEINP